MSPKYAVLAPGVALAVALSVTSAAPARAESGLERVVGPIPAATAALLPPSQELWGAYRAGLTPDVCPGGSIRCVDATISTMTQRFRALAPTCDHDAVFSLLYLRVTQEYRTDATTPGFFVRPKTVNTEDTVFGQLYSRAYNRWHADQPLTVPPVWRLALAAADTKQVSGTGDAMLGMVAHIKRDLAFSLYRILLGNHADHEAINTMLKAVYPSAAAELARRFDPLISPATLVPGTGEVFVDAIAQWRDSAWNDAVDLLGAGSDQEFDAVSLRIERAAWQTGLTIYLGTRYAARAQNTARDEYCATHWNN